MRNLLGLGFSQYDGLSGSLIDLAFGQVAKLSGNLLDLSFITQKSLSNQLLDVSFSQISGSLKRRFNGEQTINFGDFDVFVVIDGLTVPMCDLAQGMTIERGENQSAILDFVLRPAACREIDLFAWYGKKITVDVQTDRETVRLFTGFVDKNTPNPLKGLASLRCSERREQTINKLPKSTIEAIGYVSGSETFETQKDELDARLNTVPASFEILPNGETKLTDWLPKENPDFVMSRCNIYQRDFTLELNEIGGMTNVVEATVTVDYPRLLQRSVFVNFNNGLNVCNYGRYQQLPDLNEFLAAIRQTGWDLGGFDCERTEKSGFYNCGGTTPVAWLREPMTIERNDEQGTTIITRIRNLDVKTGTFELVKRWQQSIRHEFKLSVISRESVAIFGENTVNSSYSVNNETNGIEWQGLGWHNQKLRYEITTADRMSWLPFAKNRAPVLDKYLFQQSNFGDWFCDVLPENDKIRAALRVAYHAAYTQILRAHRQTVSLSCKFAPHVDLTQTHEIQHSQFSGSAKVSKITHVFDFNKKLGHTALAYQFFYLHGKKQREYTPFAEPTRNIPPTQPFSAWLPPLGRVELEKDETLADDKAGMIYRFVTLSAGVKLFNPIELVVTTPEIEKKSTETLEFQQDVSLDVNVFDSKIIVHLC